MSNDFANATASNQQGVRDMLTEEQPREKLMRHGPDALSDAELLAMLIRTGVRGRNVVDTSRDLLRKSGGLHKLCRKNWQEISGIKGIGKVKAVTLEAAFEIARRVGRPTGDDETLYTNPELVAEHFGPMLRDAHKEQFLVIYLNPRKVLIGYDRISIGGATSTIVDPPEVLRKAILNRAHSIILMHNHPSGNDNPSKADIRLTKRIADAGKMLGIPVNDHIIIAGHKFVSFANEGLI